MTQAHIDILSLGSLHDAVFQFSKQDSIDAFWRAVAANIRWVVPVRRVAVLVEESKTTFRTVARFNRGKPFDPFSDLIPYGEDAFGAALTRHNPAWLDANAMTSANDPFRQWLLGDKISALHTVPLVGANRRLGVLLLDVMKPADAEERARVTALASLYARHAASAHAVIKTTTELASKNQELELAQEQLVQASEEIRGFNATLEQRIEDRTRELEVTQKQLVGAAQEIRGFNATLEQRIEARTLELEHAQQELIEVSRRAGMAEVASAVLHNVGNALSSVNLASRRIAEQMESSARGRLQAAADMLREHENDLAQFLVNDERGKNFIPYLNQLAIRLKKESEANASELGIIREGIDHIKAIVTTQQSYAGNVALHQLCNLSRIIEDALRMSQGVLNSTNIEVACELEDLERVTVDRHKVIQILLNLISNAKQAMVLTAKPRCLVIKLFRLDGDTIAISVADNGEGVEPENAERIFSHGYTTKQEGHGFGLHHSALTAKQIGGELEFQSAGRDAGAVFTLYLPAAARDVEKLAASETLTPGARHAASRAVGREPVIELDEQPQQLAIT